VLKWVFDRCDVPTKDDANAKKTAVGYATSLCSHTFSRCTSFHTVLCTPSIHILLVHPLITGGQ
jgi:hypothetical protein